MARSKRDPYFTPTISRTLERILIAGFAALAARGSGESIAVSAISIFVVVAVIEELGKGFVYRGKRVTIRRLAQQRIAASRLWRARGVAGRRRRVRRIADRKVGGGAVDSAGHELPRDVQE